MEDRFLDIIKGKGTAGERARFFSDLEKNPEEKKAFMAFEKLWVLNKMAHKSSTKQYRQKSFKNTWQLTNQGVRLKTWQVVSGIAAVALITLLIAVSVFNSYRRLMPETMALNSPRGNISQMTLDDGSKIWLNSDSKVLVKKYGDEKMTVDLEGEAFFDVHHNPDRQFIVKVGEYAIHDVGTQFNVEFNPTCQQLKVALFDGAIDFRKGDVSINSDLKPGKMIHYDLENRDLTVNAADKEFVTAWKEGKFVFVNRTMTEIAKELEEWYDVKFVFENESIKDDEFSGVIKRRTSLEHLLRVLRLSAGTDYTIEENKDGSFTVILK